MTTSEDLAKLGTLLGTPFNQGSFRTGVGTAPSMRHRLDKNTVEGADITGGYCAGVVLDWCRRILLSASDRSATSLSYGGSQYKYPTVPVGGTMSRKEATVRRMAKAYAEQGGTYVDKTELQQVKALLPQLLMRNEQSIGEPYNATGVWLNRDEATLVSKFWKFEPNEIDLTKRPAGVLPRSVVSQLIKQAQTRKDTQNRPLDSRGRGWDDMAAILDERFAQIRVAEGRQVSKKPFSGIRVRRNFPVKDFGDASYWAGELGSSGYELNCCTLVSLSPGGGGSGHAVAVHQKGTDSFDFFDPNFGIFRMTKKNLGRCFQHLFWLPFWRDSKGFQPGVSVDGDKAVYQRRDSPDASLESPWTKMGYTIFQRA